MSSVSRLIIEAARIAFRTHEAYAPYTGSQDFQWLSKLSPPDSPRPTNRPVAVVTLAVLILALVLGILLTSNEDRRFELNTTPATPSENEIGIGGGEDPAGPDQSDVSDDEIALQNTPSNLHALITTESDTSQLVQVSEACRNLTISDDGRLVNVLEFEYLVVWTPSYPEPGPPLLNGPRSFVANESDDYPANTMFVGGSNVDRMSVDRPHSVLCGNGGDDNLQVSSGDNILVGGDGHDELLGGPGSDILLGGSGSNSLNGGAGDDLILAGD